MVPLSGAMSLSLNFSEKGVSIESRSKKLVGRDRRHPFAPRGVRGEKAPDRMTGGNGSVLSLARSTPSFTGEKKMGMR
jgi:hypothetical protein